MVYIAHVRESDKEIQTVSEHLNGVKHLAEVFGGKLGLMHVAGLAGLLHDLGKYTDIFQKYIEQVAFHPDTAEMKRGEVDHSTAGGKLLFSMFHNEKNTPYEKLLTEIVGNAIISHHSNLHDYISPDINSDFLRRVRDKDL
ncbi:CRISPR-associated endonuclease Cas3'', partial [Oceanobacillus caeni]